MIRLAETAGLTLDKLTPRRFYGLSLTLILLLNLDRVLDPPYWDALTGVYTQGVWLYQHHFDYRLLAHLPNFTAGGPNIHLFYFFAPLYAALLHVFRPTSVFLIIHLVVMNASAAGLTFEYAILRNRCPPWLALVWIASAACNPIWSGQTASLYLEIPLAAAIAVSLHAAWRRRYALAAGACLA